LPAFPTDDFILPGVGLAATNHYRFYVPVQGQITGFDQKKVNTKESRLEIKAEQSGFGAAEVIEKQQDDISKDRELKRKLLGESVFGLMNSPKIKTAKLDLIPKPETKVQNKKPQTGQGTSKIHIFKK
jgi:hypothetical protein